MSQCRDTGNTEEVLSYIVKEPKGRTLFMTHSELQARLSAYGFSYTIRGGELVVYGVDGTVVQLELEKFDRGMHELRTSTTETILH